MTPTPERVLQTHAVAALMKLARRAPIAFAGDMGGSRRSPSERLWAKNTGLTAGEPDLRIYGPGGRILFVELKTTAGRLSPAQVARHALLAGLGHTVTTIHASTGEEAANLITQLVETWLGETTRTQAEPRTTEAVRTPAATNQPRKGRKHDSNRHGSP